jgi:hypothetical protein
MDGRFPASARRLGVFAASCVVVLGTAYAAALTAGLLSLDAADQPIRDPVFTILEILILLMAPAMITLMAAIHAWAPARAKAMSLVALLFMTLAAGLTAAVHFTILTLSRQPAIADMPGAPLIFSFQWPSLAYALDILAWDVFFALSMLFGASAFAGRPLARAIRGLMIGSALFALLGLSGVATGDMWLRNIGIIGYLGIFLVVAALLGLLFHRTGPEDNEIR